MATAHTIIAISSGQLPSGVAVIRVSGGKCVDVASHFGVNLSKSGFSARKAHLRQLYDPTDGSVLDEGLVVWFPGPSSFTGEDCLEFQLHGSRAVVAKFLNLAVELPDIRLAGAGEFSRRAFENGRLDLTGVDALKDLIESETESQRRMALARKGGNLSARVADWRFELIELMAVIEADLDFSDEGDVSGLDMENVASRIEILASEWKFLISNYHRAKIVKDGFRVVLVGAPNVGKSSLLNQFAGSDVAIVSAEAGTTRDLKDVQLQLDGNLVVVTDSAGLRVSNSLAEKEGINRALDAAREADLCLQLVSGDTIDAKLPDGFENVQIWRVATKSDLGHQVGADYSVSAHSGEGIKDLLEAISNLSNLAVGREDILISQLRDKNALLTCVSLLGHRTFDPNYPELFAEQIRQVVFELDRLIGRVDVEDMLDSLFSGFCIGK